MNTIKNENQKASLSVCMHASAFPFSLTFLQKVV
jgi:hypothetical protein